MAVAEGVGVAVGEGTRVWVAVCPTVLVAFAMSRITVSGVGDASELACCAASGGKGLYGLKGFSKR